MHTHIEFLSVGWKRWTHVCLSFAADNGPCLGWRESPNKPYQWLHYNETLLRAKNFGSGLVALGLRPSPNTFVGIYSQNCPEWVLSEQGAYCYSMVIVPLYDTLGPDACAYIIKQGMKNDWRHVIMMFHDYIWCVYNETPQLPVNLHL